MIEKKRDLPIDAAAANLSSKRRTPKALAGTFKRSGNFHSPTQMEISRMSEHSDDTPNTKPGRAAMGVRGAPIGSPNDPLIGIAPNQTTGAGGRGLKQPPDKENHKDHVVDPKDSEDRRHGMAERPFEGNEPPTFENPGTTDGSVAASQKRGRKAGE